MKHLNQFGSLFIVLDLSQNRNSCKIVSRIVNSTRGHKANFFIVPNRKKPQKPNQTNLVLVGIDESDSLSITSSHQYTHILVLLISFLLSFPEKDMGRTSRTVSMS